MERELVTISKEEYDYLRWFYVNADFGPSDEDVRYIYDRQYQNNGGIIPKEYLDE